MGEARGPGHAALPGSEGAGGHDHGIAGDADIRYLAAALALIVGFMALEVVVAFISGSLALLADAAHMLTDAGAIALAIWAVRLSVRPAMGQWTFGFKRAEILSAALNGITLLVLAALLLFEAIERLMHPSPVKGVALVVVAGIGVVVNVVATLILARANRSSLNIAGAFAHVLTDLWAFVGTFVAGIIIITTGFERADALASLIVVGLMVLASWRLLRDSGRVLLEAAPKEMDLAEVERHLQSTDHVVGVHDLHAWVVSSDLPAISAHITVEEGCFNDGHAPQILDQLQACLVGHFDVEHSTFQLEPPGHQDHERAPRH
jgi:cobalt-zinc-cadmium efflux system protein